MLRDRDLLADMATRQLAAAGIPAGVLVSPLIPGLTDADMERIVALAAASGASRAGRLNDARFGSRMTGTGPVAGLLQQRFRLAIRKHGLSRQDSGWALTTERFRRPALSGQQLSLFE